MKRVMGNTGTLRCFLETTRAGTNVLFVDLDGNSYDVAASTPEKATAFANKLRRMANKIDKYAHAVGTKEF